jgi:CheY-like chemotaxis protein
MESSLNFSFQTSELADKLKQSFDETQTGYWQINIADPKNATNVRSWYVAILRGKIIFSDTEKLSWASFIKTLQRYISRLRNAQSKQALESIEQQITNPSAPSLGKLILEMQKIKLLSHDEAFKALQSKILSDFEIHLFNSSGKAFFLPENELVVTAPTQGFELNLILSEATKRKTQWTQLQKYSLSRNCALVFKADTAKALPPEKQQQLQKMLANGKTLEKLAVELGKDAIEVAKLFLPFIESGAIAIVKPSTQASGANLKKEIFIVDDSPIVIQQFHHLVTKWGYQVNYSNDAETAVDKILTCNPMAIFLDINMPGLSGFELIKLIRRQSKLATTPLVLLTAEKTVANQWRAQWANCKFLAKPRTPEESQKFPGELRALLEEMASGVPAATV